MVCNPGKGGYMYTWTRYYLYYSTEGFVLGGGMCLSRVPP